jgi:hypothetical protein
MSSGESATVFRLRTAASHLIPEFGTTGHVPGGTATFPFTRLIQQLLRGICIRLNTLSDR